MKAIRYIIFIPIIYLIISIVYYLLPISLLGLMSLSKSSLIILLIFFGGIAIAIFQFIPGGIAWLSAKISPSKNFAFYSILTISVLLGIGQILQYWTIPNLYESGMDVFLVTILTCLTIGLAISFSIGAGIEISEEKVENLSVLLSIGTIVFYLGIFLTFCLLTTRIAYINPEKTYNWYSGIWHGIFVIPHWIVSWFSDEIYCKAPNSTIAYSICWWITFIFTGLTFLGGGNRRY
jgi:hypothetical protein